MAATPQRVALGARARHLAKQVLSVVLRAPARARARAAARRAASTPPREDLAVLVTHGMWNRVAKVALALKLRGFTVVLLHTDDNFDRLDPEIRELFDHACTYTSPEDAVVQGAAFSPIAYHVFCNWNYEVARAFVLARPGVVVVDTKDVIAGFVRPPTLRRYPGRVDDERFCLENADGVCCSDLRTQFLKRRMGYRLPPRLLWFDYCWPAGFTGRLQEKPAAKRVASVGSIEADPASRQAYGYELGRLLAEKGISFHLFPSHRSNVVRLRAGIAQTISPDLATNIHVHETQPFLSLARELSGFHAGVLVSNVDVNYDDENETYFPFMADYLIASRLFDYHEAGLAILMQPMRIPSRLFRDAGVIVEVRRLADIPEIVSSSSVAGSAVAPTLRLDYHAHRLPRFYRGLYRERRARADEKPAVNYAHA